MGWARLERPRQRAIPSDFKNTRPKTLRGPVAYLKGACGGGLRGGVRASRVRSTPSLFAYNCCRLRRCCFYCYSLLFFVLLLLPAVLVE